MGGNGVWVGGGALALAGALTACVAGGGVPPKGGAPGDGDGLVADGASSEMVALLEQGLDQPGESVDVYDIFFSFDSAAIRTDPRM